MRNQIDKIIQFLKTNENHCVFSVNINEVLRYFLNVDNSGQLLNSVQ